MLSNIAENGRFHNVSQFARPAAEQTVTHYGGEPGTWPGALRGSLASKQRPSPSLGLSYLSQTRSTESGPGHPIGTRWPGVSGCRARLKYKPLPKLEVTVQR